MAHDLKQVRDELNAVLQQLEHIEEHVSDRVYSASDEEGTARLYWLLGRLNSVQDMIGFLAHDLVEDEVVEPVVVEPPNPSAN